MSRHVLTEPSVTHNIECNSLSNMLLIVTNKIRQMQQYWLLKETRKVMESDDWAFIQGSEFMSADNISILVRKWHIWLGTSQEESRDLHLTHTLSRLLSRTMHTHIIPNVYYFLEMNSSMNLIIYLIPVRYMSIVLDIDIVWLPRVV